MRNLSVSLLVGAMALVIPSCSAAPEPLPDGVGDGLLHADEQPPEGAQLYQRPVWRMGDTFTLVRGEQLRGTFTVVEADKQGYAIDMGQGRVLRRDRDLGNVGEWQGAGEDATAVRLMSPVDVRYHWPLWVGKTWSCRFVDRVRGGRALLMQADYRVEGQDRLAVPAGDYETLRVVRSLRLAEPEAEGKFLTRTQVAWFAPELGLEVRQLLGDTLVELVAFERADGGSGQ
ncbi:MAG: hypothetical protein AB8H80_11005 [Planctomycetota bacterium]